MYMYRYIRFSGDKFPGKILYAVKTNPHPEVIKSIIDSGIDHFDVASIDGTGVATPTISGLDNLAVTLTGTTSLANYLDIAQLF